jgi:Tfp pilus assembly protein PilV
MLIASMVFTVGAVSLMSMVLFALASRYASRIESAALRLSQQKMEELKSYPIGNAALSIPGNTLNAEGNIDFAASAAPEATSITELILNKARDTTLAFETRWNVTTSGNKKVITVATRKTGGAPAQVEPVNLKLVIVR